ncbi:RagB/SusD family nutrient uptake outer membrane protein [Pedobacter xixiisoli]|uniref:Starch-binding associating with outer membrane n=1 Tax=Pedobacter xixiisoli TaxID=1476464 RepID=A0A286ACY9_9SPHI|nr:RagB/SusD family nutrient uptake outer membrane protein [Pedobacter xixiisoli]SOD19758.1 Starch-binding associating with outer membrane [Pedobacter xixiisoli]
MKKYSKIKLLICFLLMISLCSCKKFLDIVPQSDPTSASFYKTSDDIKNALSGCYASLQSGSQYRGHFITMMETRSDNISDNNSGGNAGRDYNVDRFLANSDNIVFLESWRSIYNTIYRCNAALSKIDVVANSALKSQYESELRFIRALNYFNAVRFWGDIPLVLSPISPEESYKVIRNNKSEVYKAIEDDLKVAAENLPATFTGDNLGRATRGAAKSLLGKVYLTQQKYALASTVLKEVIDSKTYILLDNVSSVFATDNKMNNEIIFAVRFNKSVVGEGRAIPTYFDGPVLDAALLSGYAATDTRRDLLNTLSSNTRNPVKKYYDTFDLNTNNVGNDFPILRYADVLLMYAEALNEQNYEANGSAMEALNLIRFRANTSLFTGALLADKVSFRDAVYQERRLELPLEWSRWFDLIRTNTAIEAMKKVGLTIQNWQFLYPIPLTEVQIMNNAQSFPQNPNY